MKKLVMLVLGLMLVASIGCKSKYQEQEERWNKQVSENTKALKQATDDYNKYINEWNTKVKDYNKKHTKK
jgi:uncharacterized protein YxeA